MPITIEEGYTPGCIGRVAQLHAADYSRSTGFGIEFEAKVVRETGDFCNSCTRVGMGCGLPLMPRKFKALSPLTVHRRGLASSQ